MHLGGEFCTCVAARDSQHTPTHCKRLSVFNFSRAFRAPATKSRTSATGTLRPCDHGVTSTDFQLRMQTGCGSPAAVIVHTAHDVPACKSRDHVRTVYKRACRRTRRCRWPAAAVLGTRPGAEVLPGLRRRRRAESCRVRGMEEWRMFWRQEMHARNWSSGGHRVR